MNIKEDVIYTEVGRVNDNVNKPAIKERKIIHKSFFFSSPFITLADSPALFYCLVLYIFYLKVYLQTKLMPTKSNIMPNIMNNKTSLVI